MNSLKRLDALAAQNIEPVALLELVKRAKTLKDMPDNGVVKILSERIWRCEVRFYNVLDEICSSRVLWGFFGEALKEHYEMEYLEENFPKLQESAN